MKPTSEFDGDKALHVETCCGVLSILLAIEFHHVVLEIFGWFTPRLKPENLKGAEVLLDGLGAKHGAAEAGVELAKPSRSAQFTAALRAVRQAIWPSARKFRDRYGLSAFVVYAAASVLFFGRGALGQLSTAQSARAETRRL